MLRKSKVTAQERIEAVKAVIAGEICMTEAARRLKIALPNVLELVYRYEEGGEVALREAKKYRVYSDTIKLKAVKAYQNGEGSLIRISARFGLRSSRQLRNWIKVYNSGGKFKHKMSGGSHLKTARKTTKEERIKIVRECLENGNNYGEIALKYNVSYQQVYTWTKDYSTLGQTALEDRRGKRLAKQEPRSEVEAMKIRMAQLEHELYMTRMERDLLKKLKELERGDVFLK